MLLYYAVYLISLVQWYGNDWTIFINIGSYFAYRPGVVSQIVQKIGFGPPYLTYGYDGQFYYYIALDPLNAWQLLDTPARYQRILYPVLVRLLSFGTLSAVPYLMVMVNLAFISVGTEFLARFLKLHDLNPWYSIGYAFNIGQLVCLRRDLVEPIMYAFVIAAVYLIERRGPTVLAGVLFSLALFAKETALLFILPYVFWIVFSSGQSKLRSMAFSAIVILPYTLFQVLLFYRFGLIAILAAGNPQTITLIPFYGIVHIQRNLIELISIIILIVIPAAASPLLFLGGTLKLKRVHPLALALLVNGLFLVFLPPASYTDVFTYSRVALGLAVAWMGYGVILRNKLLLTYSLLWAIPFQFTFLVWLV